VAYAAPDRGAGKQFFRRSTATAGDLPRAVLGNPAVLLLDEATQRLDAESEQAGASRAWSKRWLVRTVLVDCPSPRTVQGADQILVLEAVASLKQGKPRPS